MDNSNSVWRRFLRHKPAMIGSIVFALIVLSAIFAPLLTPYSPYELSQSFEAAPSSEHILGTDLVSRDVFTRLLYGSRVSLLVGVGTVIVYVIIGGILGTLAGYFGGWVDSLIMRFTDIIMSFPFFIVILVMVSILGPAMSNIIFALGVLGWPPIARIIRGSILTIKNQDYIKAGRVLGYSDLRLIFKHILPNIMAPILVNATFGVSNAIIAESSLSFLGMGVQPPRSSWGNILTDAQSMTILAHEPWLWVPAGLMIVITVLSVNFIGDGLRDALDPKKIQ
ncbi:MAG: ABC transporter permease [Spirochaetales bacterium]|nr:ABC transporter permease [Spirochaetales bacterium]